MIAEDFENTASWRESLTEQYPDDERNERAAQGLYDAAEYVRTLPDDDSRFHDIATAISSEIADSEGPHRILRGYGFALGLPDDNTFFTWYAEEWSSQVAVEAVYREDPDRIRRLIINDSSARDVPAIAHRQAVVERFRRLLEDPQFFKDAADAFGGRKEAVWQNLLEENPWILGVSLAGQILTSWSEEKLEQVVAGFSISGPGKRTDALMHTSGQIRALVFAEIKHHETDLLGEEYRSGAWAPSSELSKGVAQVQKTIHLASRQIGGRLPETDETGAETGEHTYLVRPRSFLILGSLQQFRGARGVHRAKYESFELYRRNLYEPEVITFDELLTRAEWHVEVVDKKSQR